ncbi:hypothetical protein B566_EDAN001560 [Ephemera danica]|nr:hypothetical protein B566_EDAN001560 [Ephemera danica]
MGAPMARMQAMEVRKQAMAGGGGAAAVAGVKTEVESVGPLVSRGGSGASSTTRKVSFRVRGAGRRRRDSRARQNTVAALTSKFNALNGTVQPSRVTEEARTPRGVAASRGRPRGLHHAAPGAAHVVTTSRSHLHPVMGGRISSAASGLAGGVKATIQIFEQQQQQVQEQQRPIKVNNASPAVAAKPSSLVPSSKSKSLVSKKLESKLVVNGGLSAVKQPTQAVAREKKVVHVPPKPSTTSLPLIKSPQSTNKLSTHTEVKLTKPVVPVKNQHIIKEYLEATEKIIKCQEKCVVDKLKPNRSALFLPLISSHSVQTTKVINEVQVKLDEPKSEAVILDCDLEDDTPTQERSLVDEVLSELAQKRILVTDDSSISTPLALPVKRSSEPSPAPDVPPSTLPPPLPASNPPAVETPETPRPPPNTSFLWSVAVAQRDLPEQPEDYEDVYVQSARNSYAALRPDEEDGYEYCGGTQQPHYEDAPSRPNSRQIYDDVKSLAAASNCYESIGSCAPSYCEKNNSLYGLPEELRPGHVGSGNTSSSTCSLGSASPVVSRASTVSAGEDDEEGDGAPHEVLSYQLFSHLGTSDAAASAGGEALTPGERPSEAGSDEWVDIELSESEEQLGPPVDLSEALAMSRERSRPKRSPSWSHMVRLQHQMARAPNRRLKHVYVSSSSVLYLLGPRHDIGPPPERPPRPARASKQTKPPEASEPPFVTFRLRLLQESAFRESQEVVIFFRDPAEVEAGSSSSDSDHHYETLYETVGGPGDAATLKPSHTPAPPPPLDEDEAFDSDVTDSSFDSDTSDEAPPIYRHPPGVQAPELPELPPPPPGSNKKITKIAEAAGRKMRKFRNNLTLRKKDFIRRLSTPFPPVPMTPSNTPTAESPPKPPASTPPLLVEKSVSTGNLNNRKSWSFKDKFARQSSTGSMKRESTGSSVFYVSPSTEQPDLPPSSQHQEIGERDTPQRRSKTESVCSSGRGSSAGSEADTSAAPRRLSRLAVRPKTPPPPPPTEGSIKNGKSGWYADIEISSLQPPRSDSSSESVAKNGHSSMEADLSWYSEIGLGSSNGEAEGSHTTSGASSSGSPEGSVVHGCFADEPLYQFYAASVLEEAKRELNESDSDGYEEIGEGCRNGSIQIMTSRPSAMDLIRPREGHRTLWCEVPDVIESRILDAMNQQQRKLQEAKFEVITSEASYVKSLGILATHFVQCPEFHDEAIISKTDKHTLFSNIMPVKSCSDRFLADLERCWQEDILLPDISDVVLKHALKNFRVYIKYCSHQIYLDRTLRKLKEGNSAFSEALTKLEAAPECQSLSLHSFLMLPMQRVTRLPLLMDAVIRRLSARDAEYETCKNALFTLNKVVQDCNEGARCMERMEEMLLLSRQLEFREDVRAVPLISSTRWLVRSGELTQLTWRDDAKLTFGRRLGKVPVCVFLFTDLLVVAKRKGDESFQVLDYCARNLVQVSNPEDGPKQLPVRGGEVQGRNLLLLTLLQNHESRTVEMMLSCALESDRQRWLSAFAPPAQPENPEERVYEEWDCPQVQAVHAYTARQPDELSLEVADVVNVMRKLPDGWYQGERIRDGERGWFPGNYCREVLSSHVRARNLRQRYRLLALSRDYLEQQREALKQQTKPRKTSKPKMPLPNPTTLTSVS